MSYLLFFEKPLPHNFNFLTGKLNDHDFKKSWKSTYKSAVQTLHNYLTSLRNGMLFVLAYVARVVCLYVWRASMDSLGGALAWVAC